MGYDQVLAERVRAAIGKDAGVRERKMFCGRAFLLNGNVAVSAHKGGGLMIRCSGEDWQAFCSEEGARPMLRRALVSGSVQIGADAVRDEAPLNEWVRRELADAGARPPK